MHHANETLPNLGRHRAGMLASNRVRQRFGAGCLARGDSEDGAIRGMHTYPWGMGYCLSCGSYVNWPDNNQIKQNYTVCAGFDHAINITWNTNTVETTYVNVSIGTTLLARNGSGTILIPYSLLPADKENVTLTNDNGTAIGYFTYEIMLVNQYPAPLAISNVPIQGGGVVIAIAYAAIIVFGIASLKLPQKLRILALIGNIVMPTVWFGGLAMNQVPVMDFSHPLLIIGSGTFTVPENSGLVLSVAIDFEYSDPYYMGFEYILYKGRNFLMGGVPVYYGEFGVGSAFEGYESETEYLPLPPGEYSLEYTAAPSPRMEVGIYVLSAWSDIAPATSIGMWRWAFLIIGICAAVLALVGVIKGKRPGKTTKIIPKPTFANTGNMVDVPFSAISSSTVAAPPAPLTAKSIVSWTCDACRKANEETAKFCIGCGKARHTG